MHGQAFPREKARSILGLVLDKVPTPDVIGMGGTLPFAPSTGPFAASSAASCAPAARNAGVPFALSWD
jgi:hypothetical protein